MKKSSLIAVATALLALSGCSDHSVYGPQTELDEKEYNSFDFSTINNNVAVNIEYSVNLEASVFFSIYDQEPGSWVENAYVLKDGIQPLYSGWTSKDGTFSASLSLPSYLKKVYVYTPAMFSTRVMEAEVNGSQINVVENNYASQAITRGHHGGNSHGSHRPAPGEPGYNENNKPQQPTSNKNYSYMVKGTQKRPTEYNDGNWYDWLVTYNNQGMLHNESLIENSDKEDEDLYLGKKLAGKLYEVHQAVINVDKKECPKELRSEYDMYISQEGEIAINFLGGSTCWNSSLGYYVYRDGEKPASLDKANVVLVFPNTQDGFKTNSYNGEETKGAFTGDCVKLKYYPNIASGSQEGATYKFPAGYRIGFVLATNAWSNRIKGWGPNYRVRSATSSGLSVDRNGKIFNEPRTAVYKYTDENKKDYIMVSFEDNTDDNNFSDVVFTLTTRATIDKIPDVDPKVEVNELKGIYAFEDLWPAKGDYDMNDVMTKSTYTKLVDSKNKIYEESYTFKTYGNYATLVSGLAVRLDGVSATDKLEFYVKSADEEKFSVLNTTYDTNDKVVVLANDVNNNKGAEYKVKVIHAEESPVEKQTIEAEPFIFRAENSSDAVAWWEVHLTGYKPTSKMNFGYFNTGDDCSQPDKDIFYVRKGNYPFAFFLAGATDEDLKPMLDPDNESTPINELYSGYSDWVTNNGTTNTDWYKSAE